MFYYYDFDFNRYLDGIRGTNGNGVTFHQVSEYLPNNVFTEAELRQKAVELCIASNKEFSKLAAEEIYEFLKGGESASQVNKPLSVTSSPSPDGSTPMECLIRDFREWERVWTIDPSNAVPIHKFIEDLSKRYVVSFL